MVGVSLMMTENKLINRFIACHVFREVRKRPRAANPHYLDKRLRSDRFIPCLFVLTRLQAANNCQSVPNLLASSQGGSPGLDWRRAEKVGESVDALEVKRIKPLP